jgi:hypothetical protein
LGLFVGEVGDSRLWRYGLVLDNLPEELRECVEADLGRTVVLVTDASESGRKWEPGPVSCDGSGAVRGSIRYSWA